jgi:hypothetical protein
MARKKKETMGQFVKRRNTDEMLKRGITKHTSTTPKGKETGKVKIEEDKYSRPLEGGSHSLWALQRHFGIVKKKTAKKLEKREHLKKKRQLEGKV